MYSKVRYLLNDTWKPLGPDPLFRRSSQTGFPGIKGGLPHSEIHGSKLIRSSPWLIAAYHVLHRLCMPRHSPDALKTLDRSHRQSPSIPSRQNPDRRERTVIDAYHFSKHRKHGTACNGSPTSCSGARASRTSIEEHPTGERPASRDGTRRWRSGTSIWTRPLTASSMGMARIVTPKGDEPSGNPPRRNRLQRTSQHIMCRDPRLPIPQDPSSSSLVIRTRHPNGQTLRTANLVSLHKMMNPEPLDTIRQTAWWSLSGSNRRPSACKADALPAELRPRLSRQTDTRTMKPKLNQSLRTGGPG